MKKLVFILCFFAFFWGVSLTADAPPRCSSTAISILRSSLCPKGPVYVQAVVKEALDTDTYIIEDASGAIILFLPTEELEAMPLVVGKKILIYGRVDISPATPDKNELYAEKIVFLEQK